MNTDLVSVQTAQAAEIAGIGYEGLRSWLKRGLLKDTGALPKFYGDGAAVEPADTKRWRWAAFGFADLCSFRITKLMLDAGLPWEVVSPIVSDQALWRTHRQDDPDSHYLMIFQNGREWILGNSKSLMDGLDGGLIKGDWMFLVDLRSVRQDVMFRCRGPHGAEEVVT